MKNKKIVLQISDLHLLADKEGSVFNVNTYASFMRVIDAIKNFSLPIDLLLLTGDLSQDMSKESYLHLKDVITSLNLPTCFVPGNHDDIDHLYKILPNHLITANKIVDLGQWCFILLNSVIPNEIPGYLSDKELDFLKTTLFAYQQKNIIIALHHHPIPINSDLMDKYILKNHVEFRNLIDNYQQIKAIIFGHIHQEVDTSYKNKRYLSCPSTCFQFIPGASKLEFDTLGPGLRLFELEETITTKIIRI